MRIVILTLTCLAAMLLVVGCGGDDGNTDAQKQHAAQQGGQNQGSQHSGPGHKERPEQPATPVAVQASTLGSIASYYNATATLEAEKQAEILARVYGVIQSLECEEGDIVSEGDILLRIDNNEYQLRLDQAAANTANVQSRFDRIEKMRDEDVATEEEFQAALSELATAVADEGMARLNVSYTTVTSPFRGKVVERLVDVGQNVNVNNPLFVLADFDPLLARVHVPSKEFKKLQVDQNVTLQLDSNQQRLQGRIKLISPVIDPTSGTIKITVEISDYPADTRPGDFAEVQIVTERRQDVVLVPKIAVLTDKGEDVVFVASDGLAERRVVEVGFRDNDHAEITSGIASGELVVVKGQRSIKNGDPLKILSGAGATEDQDDTQAALARTEES